MMLSVSLRAPLVSIRRVLSSMKKRSVTELNLLWDRIKINIVKLLKRPCIRSSKFTLYVKERLRVVQQDLEGVHANQPKKGIQSD